MSKTDLIARARELKIKGFTKMNEAALQAAIVDEEKRITDEAAKAEAEAAAGPPHDPKDGITARIAKIQLRVPQVTKTGEVSFKGTNYKHIQEHGILSVLKPLMERYHVGILTDVQSWQRDGNHVSLMVAYTLFCTDQPRNDADQQFSVTVHFPTEGVDSTDKAMNKALTNGMKYALQKTFLIPTDMIDDVEGSNDAHNTQSTSSGGAGGKATNTVLAGLRARAATAVQEGTIPNETVKAYLSSEFGTSKVTDLSGTQAVTFGEWLTEKGA